MAAAAAMASNRHAGVPQVMREPAASGRGGSKEGPCSNVSSSSSVAWRQVHAPPPSSRLRDQREGDQEALGPAAWLHDWLEQEVASRLQAIEEKLDRALESGRPATVQSPPPHFTPNPNRFESAYAAAAAAARQSLHSRQVSIVVPVGPTNTEEELEDEPDVPEELRSHAPSEHPSIAEATVRLTVPTRVSLAIASAAERATATVKKYHEVALVKQLPRRRAMVETFMFTRERPGNRKVLDSFWSFFEDPDSSFGAKVYARILPCILLMTVLVTLLEAADDPPIDDRTFSIMEVVIESTFCLEALIRFLATPGLRVYFQNPYNLIDLAAISPLALRLAKGVVISVQVKDRNSLSLAVLLGAVPFLRLLKLLRQFQKIHLLLRAFQMAVEALPVVVFIYGSLMLIFSFLMYLVEPADNIPSLPAAMWLTIESMTTVGYGDIYPASTMGKGITTALVFFTTLYMAIPLGIIGNAFSEVWDDRDRILLAQRMRSMLLQCGYDGRSIPLLFDLFDQDRDGLLTFEEFQLMVTEMGLGLTENRVLELFQLADADGSGSIQPKEFVKLLFPSDYHTIFMESLMDVDSKKANRGQGGGHSADRASNISCLSTASMGAFPSMPASAHHGHSPLSAVLPPVAAGESKASPRSITIQEPTGNGTAPRSALVDVVVGVSDREPCSI